VCVCVYVFGHVIKTGDYYKLKTLTVYSWTVSSYIYWKHTVEITTVPFLLDETI